MTDYAVALFTFGQLCFTDKWERFFERKEKVSRYKI